jgi:hypothetical protein
MTALAFPLAVADFWGPLKVQVLSWSLSQPMEGARSAGGSVLTSRLGEPLWQAEARLAPSNYADALRNDAILALAQSPGATFLAHDKRATGPRLDPAGTILGAALPTLHTLDGDGKRIRVQGLPAGYVLSRGDYLGWPYGSPARVMLTRVINATVTADGAGLTPLFEVFPRPRGGTAGAAVTLRAPVAKFRFADLTFGSASPGVHDGASFSIIERIK